MEIDRRIKELQEEIKFNSEFPSYVKRCDEEIIKLKNKRIYEHRRNRDDWIQKRGVRS